MSSRNRLFPACSSGCYPMAGEACGQPPFPVRLMRSRARSAVFAFLCLIAAPAAGAAQHAGHLTELPVAVDGAKNPEKIPEDLAAQHFLLAISVPASPSPVELKRQEAQLASLGLAPAERAVVKQELARFRQQWDELEVQWERAGRQAQPEEQSRAVSAISAARRGLAASTISRIRGLLSVESGEKLERHIQTRVKSRIIIYGTAR